MALPPGSTGLQHRGLCFGFIEIPGLDRHEAALAGALIRGEHDKAHRFFAAVEGEVPPAVWRRMDEALRQERSGGGAGRDYLLGHAVVLLPRSFEPTAAQDARGNCRATDSWRWVLSPQEWPYGRCSPGEGCPTTGSLRIDMRANIFGVPNGLVRALLRRGIRAEGPHRLDVGEDEAGPQRGPRPDHRGLQLPKRQPAARLRHTRESGTGIEDYYYISTRFSGTPAGEPSWSFEFQTRRWKVGPGPDAEFPAAGGGG